MTEPRYVYGVAGSRDYHPDDELFFATQRVKELHPDAMLAVGDAKGVDEVAVMWAKQMHIPYICEKANWETGKGAGHERNARVVERITDTALAYFHPKPLTGLPESSPGTCDFVTQAHDRGLKVFARHQGKWLEDGALERIYGLVHQKWVRLGLPYPGFEPDRNGPGHTHPTDPGWTLKPSTCAQCANLARANL